MLSRGITVIALLLVAVPAFAQSTVVMNEIRVDMESPQDDEYIEIFVPDGASLTGLTLVVIQGVGDPPSNHGRVEDVEDLSGASVPADGFLVLAENSFTLGTADVETTLDFQDDPANTFLIVEGWSGADSSDLDADDDGVLDTPLPWTDVVDEVALIGPDTPPDEYYPYSTVTVGPNGTLPPAHVYRCPDETGDWQIGAFDIVGGDDTPGDPNDCPDEAEEVLEPVDTAEAVDMGPDVSDAGDDGDVVEDAPVDVPEEVDVAEEPVDDAPADGADAPAVDVDQEAGGDAAAADTAQQEDPAQQDDTAQQDDAAAQDTRTSRDVTPFGSGAGGEDDDGCGCGVGARAGHPWWWVALAGVVAVTVRRRRRSRRQSRWAA